MSGKDELDPNVEVENKEDKNIAENNNRKIYIKKN